MRDNRFRDDIVKEKEAKRKADSIEKEKIEPSQNFLATFFSGVGVSKEVATAMMSFVVYLAMLGMFYIGNRHFAEKNIRSIDKLGKEVKELSWDYKTLKADLMLKSTQTELAKRVDTMGLKEPIEPPKKIILTVDEYQN